MKEKHPGQHVHGHRSLHTQAMTRLFLLDFGNPRPGQDLDRRAFGVEILDWHVRYGSRKKPCGLLANRRRQAPCAAANGAAAQSEWLGHCLQRRLREATVDLVLKSKCGWALAAVLERRYLHVPALCNIWQNVAAFHIALLNECAYVTPFTAEWLNRICPLQTTSSACRSKSCKPVCSINVRSIDRRPIVH